MAAVVTKKICERNITARIAGAYLFNFFLVFGFFFLGAWRLALAGKQRLKGLGEGEKKRFKL